MYNNQPLPHPSLLPSIASYPRPHQHFVRRIRSINALPPCRPRPLYFMPNRGPSTVLSPKIIRQLTREDPQHPRLRTHYAACYVIQYFLAEAPLRPEHEFSFNSSPLRIKILCRHYNTQYLTRPTDVKLSPRPIWRLIYRRYNSIPRPIISHQAIFIQQRRLTPDEAYRASPARRKPSCTNQIGEDFHTISNNTTILQPNGDSLMYVAADLQCRPHGSVGIDEIYSRDLLFSILKIDNHKITPESAGVDRFDSKNNVYVAYSRNQHLINLNKKIKGGVASLHRNLTITLLSGKHDKDPARTEGQVVDGEPSVNVRMRFGYGRVQTEKSPNQKWKVHPWSHNGKQMPTICYLPFINLSVNLQKQLITLFESAQTFVERHTDSPFSDKNRTLIFSKLLNKKLGYPRARFKFEYFDIVLSRNTVLPKHIDSKNDHRPGYNYCAVYSFFETVNGLEYKVSVIMCTRSSVGSAMEKAVRPMDYIT